MFRDTSTREETILKKAFNRWGIFDLYEKLEIIIKPIRNKTLPVLINETSSEFSKNNNTEQLKKSTQSKYEFKKTIRDFDVFVCSNRDQKELTIELQPIYSGIIIGQLKNKKFFPNLNFAELIVTYNPKLNYPYIIIENKAANLAIYGRDIMGNSIIDYFKEIKENQILIILNQKKEVLGIGRSRFNNNLITQNNKITIDNIQDIGTHYLQDENNYAL
jgi:60S ribosome subunit biogenesis protein NIP7